MFCVLLLSDIKYWRRWCREECMCVCLFYLHGGVVCLFIWANTRLTQKHSIHHVGVDHGKGECHCGKWVGGKWVYRHRGKVLIATVAKWSVPDITMWQIRSIPPILCRPEASILYCATHPFRWFGFPKHLHLIDNPSFLRLTYFVAKNKLKNLSMTSFIGSRFLLVNQLSGA